MPKRHQYFPISSRTNDLTSFHLSSLRFPDLREDLAMTIEFQYPARIREEEG
jgi:hypothetical protein